MAAAVTFPRRGADYAPLPRGKSKGRVRGHAVQTINASPAAVFNVYSRLELLPTWQEGVVSVTRTGDTTHHWVMQDPGTGAQLEFDAETLEATPGTRYVSRIVNGPLEGTVDTLVLEEQAYGRGTIATWTSNFHLPGGALSNAIHSFISRGPEQMLIENLRHLKELLESGQIPNITGQPAGPRGVMGKWKQFLMGENMPTPPGSSGRAQPQDLPQDHDTHALLLGSIAVAAGAAAWYGIRKFSK